MNGRIIIETERTYISLLDESQAELIRDYYLNNQAHLSDWEPLRTSSFYDIQTWHLWIRESQQLYQAGSAFSFVVFDKQCAEVIGVCNFTNVVRGVFQACNLGYSIDEAHQGHGYMFEVLNAAINYMFEEIGLHRIMANYQPENKRSAVLLDRLGFEKEGFAKSYLKLNGEWRDHVLTSKINMDK